ncbi:MAG: hypothetical protein HZB41_10120 [Ignavibacteriae bacterium]|nr:hypothetical protein [Ignavibacteriota bacterium]
MNSENDYISIRDIIIDNINYKPFLNFNYEKFKKIGIVFLLLIFLVVLANGFIHDFALVDIISAFLCVLLVAFLFAFKFENNDDILLNHVFTCPHCLKNILVKNIDEIKCPYCDAEGQTFHNVLFGCSHCDDPVRLLNCPHCQEVIDLDAPYDVQELKERRYESEEILCHD